MYSAGPARPLATAGEELHDIYIYTYIYPDLRHDPSVDCPRRDQILSTAPTYVYHILQAGLGNLLLIFLKHVGFGKAHPTQV